MDFEATAAILIPTEDYLHDCLAFLAVADDESDPYAVDYAWSVVRPYVTIQ